jgi:hypothetical protein
VIQQRQRAYRQKHNNSVRKEIAQVFRRPHDYRMQSTEVPAIPVKHRCTHDLIRPEHGV